MKKVYLFFIAAFVFASCNNNKNQFDAAGNFEASEVIVSSEISGKIITLSVNEGDTASANSVVGTIDAVNINLQKQQVEASAAALNEKTANAAPNVQLLNEQLAVQQSQLNNLLYEQKRIENLLKQDAATGKQLDDINAQVDVVKKQMAVTRQQITVQLSNTSLQNRTVLSEKKPLQIRAAQLQDQLNRAHIINPINGTVLTKYAEAGEVTAAGKALYKIADLSTMKLRAYVSGSQLPIIKLGQQVKVFIDNDKGGYTELPGTITWISDKAEFTPKTIQTKEERVNLVYAIKVNVKNNGYLKIGMYGEVKLAPNP
ncbi:MAG: HlyD family efflux transporter periplasmic adaptor subunit [Chitinophagaceae bacterium]|nr:HlyD family efflux transporter periplasmic adaptor subunit [Chitinophagaceae bacterium]